MDTKQLDKKRNFNKKKWRETQYSHKQKVSEWENNRKLAVKRKYSKMLKKEGPVPSYQHLYDEENKAEVEGDDDVNGYKAVRTKREPPARLSEFQRAKQEFERLKKLKEEAKQEKARKRREREEAIQKSKQVRLERIKKLTQKTKKGQPVMKGRIEILLEKIQKQASSDT